MIYAHKRGLTLIEIMISVALLAVFGLMIVGILNQSVQVWKITEDRREILEMSRNIMKLLSDDLNSLYIPNNTNEIGLLVDRDSFGRQRLRFIKKIAHENTHSVLRYAGTQPAENGEQLAYYDEKVGANKRLLAPGGLAEVMYCFDLEKNNRGLWRGVRSPIGGEGSFFHDRNIDTPQKIQTSAHLLTDKILYWEIKNWAQNTMSWDNKEPPQKDISIKGGASPIWDSSRKRLPDFFLTTTALINSQIKPLKVNISIVFQDGKPKELAANLGAEDTTLYLDNTKGFAQNKWKYALIDKEWISYEDSDNTGLYNLRRGMLNSKIEDHEQYKKYTRTYYEKWDVYKTTGKSFEVQEINKVYSGVLFNKTISLP